MIQIAYLTEEFLGEKLKLEVYQEATRLATQVRPRVEEKERSLMALFVNTLEKINMSALSRFLKRHTFFH